MKDRDNLGKLLVQIVLLAFLILGPLFVREYWLHVIVLFTIDLILVTSFWMITTMGGWSFAHIALMGVGSYTSALLTTKLLHWSFWLTLPLGGLATALIALAISYPCLRTKGVYFFLSTFAAGEALRQGWLRFELFGRRLGIPFIGHPDPILGIDFTEMLPNYYLVLAIALLSMFILYRLAKSRVGDTIKAVRSSEELCESVGVNTWGYKALAFVVGSFFAGLAGVLSVHYSGSVCPQDFNAFYSYKIITAVIIGGSTTFSGPIVGLVFVTLIAEMFRDWPEWVPFIYGALIIVILMLFPRGLEDLPRKVSPLVEKMQMIGRGMMRYVTRE